MLQTFVDVAGRLIRIPVHHKKRLAVLRWLVEDFQPGRLYPEEEVNRTIARRHPDFAALRRHLVDEELMQRRGGAYWRTGSVANVGYDPPECQDSWRPASWLIRSLLVDATWLSRELSPAGRNGPAGV